jgi:hypothetical protein
MQTKRSEIDQGGPSRADPSASAPEPVDDTDYEHRHFINLVAIAFLLVIAGAIIWTVRAIDENERLQRCFNSGRRDCMMIDATPSTAVRLPVR